jgi:hypothetical protein
MTNTKKTNTMKTTVKIPTTQDIEVSLPSFWHNENKYFMFKDSENARGNIYVDLEPTYACIRNYADPYDITREIGKGAQEISADDFRIAMKQAESRIWATFAVADLEMSDESPETDAEYSERVNDGMPVGDKNEKF